MNRTEPRVTKLLVEKLYCLQTLYKYVPSLDLIQHPILCDTLHYKQPSSSSSRPSIVVIGITPISELRNAINFFSKNVNNFLSSKIVMSYDVYTTYLKFVGQKMNHIVRSSSIE